MGKLQDKIAICLIMYWFFWINAKQWKVFIINSLLFVPILYDKRLLIVIIKLINGKHYL